MSLESILGSIYSKGEHQVALILKEAEDAASVILQKARRDADKVMQERIRIETGKASLERYSVINSALQLSQKQIGEKRAKFVEQAFQSASEQLCVVRNRDDYPMILGRLITEAINEMEESQEDIRLACLHVDPRDKEIVIEYLETKSIQMQVDCTEQNWGGVVLTSQDNKLVVINTIESRIEMAKPYLRQVLARYLE